MNARSNRIHGVSAVLLLATCTSVLLLTMAAMRQLQRMHRTAIVPRPTSPEVIAALHQLNARLKIDAAGRVWSVDIARLPVVDSDLAILAKLPELRSLNMRGINQHGGRLTDRGLKHLRGLRNLRSLNLSANQRNLNPNQPITDVALQHLQSLTRLERLDVSGTGVTDVGVSYLRDLPKLKQLSVSGYRPRYRSGVSQAALAVFRNSPIQQIHGVSVRRDGFKYVGGLRNLRRYPSDWQNPHDTDLIRLKNLTKLQDLAVILSNGWSDSSLLSELQPLKGLKRLDIIADYDSNVSPDWSGLAALGQLPHLQQLCLRGVPDEALQHLPKIDSLELLDLTQSPVSGIGLRGWSGASNIKVIGLNRYAVTERSLADLQLCQNLRELWLCRSPFFGNYLCQDIPEGIESAQRKPGVTDATLKDIGQASKLKVLKLDNCPITDAGLFHIQHLTQLEVLWLDGSQLTDTGTARLHNLQNLRKLSFLRTAVSREAAVQLSEFAPYCEITDNWCCGCLSVGPRR